MCFNKLHSEFRVQACCFVFFVESPSFQVKALGRERATEVSPMDGLGWFWFLFVSESIVVPEDAIGAAAWRAETNPEISQLYGL